MSERVVVDPRSQLKIRTRAKGLLSRLAHDLEMEATIEGEGTRDGDRYEGTMTVRLDSVRVVGTLRHNELDRNVLSAADCAEIERKIRHEVFRGEPEVTVRVKGDDVRVCFGERMSTVRPNLEVVTRGDETEVHAKCTVTMRALGLAEVKGPIGAFSIKDDVEIEATVIVRPA
jgi:hypothetical protein